MEEMTKFMILMPWGRVGSNVLMNNIAQICAIKERKFENENFNDIVGAEGQIRWAGEFYRNLRGLKLVGSKQNILSIADVDGLSAFLAETSVQLIRLRRRNIVKVAVSQLRAELYAAYSMAQSGVALWGVPSGSQPLGPAELDPACFLEILTTAKRADDLLVKFNPQTRAIDIEYEELKCDPEGVAERICRWLGLPIVRRAQSKYTKATPDDLSMAVTNLFALRESLKKSDLASLDYMFDEV